MDKETEKYPPGASSSIATKGNQPYTMPPEKKSKLEEGSSVLGGTSARTLPKPLNFYNTEEGEFTSLDDVDPHTTYVTVEKLQDVSELDRLQKLTKLETLDFTDCDFSMGLPLVVTGLASLKHLYLTHCVLTDLPPQMSQLVQLQTLHIHLNPFSTLPPVVCELRSLKELNISHCYLRKLPAEMSQLVQLQKLCISGNDFPTLPPVVCELRSLKELNISRCKLSELPPEFRNLKDLQELDVRWNNFTILPPAIFQLKKLRRLDLQANKQLKRIEKEIIELPDLSELDCGECDSLEHPPYAVCMMGLSAVKKYFTDLGQQTATPQSSVAGATSGSKDDPASTAAAVTEHSNREGLSVVGESQPFHQIEQEILQPTNKSDTESVAESNDEPAGRETAHTEHASQDCEPVDVYLNFTEHLGRFLNSAKVPHFMIYEDLDVASKIIVAGPNVSQLRDELDAIKAKNKSYAEFELVVKDSTPRSPDSPNMWIDNYQSVRCSLSDRENSSISVIELMMKGSSVNGNQPAFYGATTAHSFLTKIQQRALINDDQPSTVKPIWEQVEASSREREYVMSTEVPGIQPIDVVGPPYPFYRHWYPNTSNFPPLLDIAVFEFNRRPLHDDGWLTGKFDWQNGRDLEHLKSTPTKFRSMKEIKSLEDLYSLGGRSVLCNQKLGRILQPQVYGKEGAFIGRHLSFTLDYEECLKPGDCGSLVYLLGDDSDQTSYMVGMFFGTSTEEPRMHQAVILSAAFSAVRKSQPFQQTEMNIFLPPESLEDPISANTDQTEEGENQPVPVTPADDEGQAELTEF